MDKHINLASLPKDEALQHARAGGRSIFGDEGAVSSVYTDLLRHWIDANMPCAVGQTDEEFDEIMLEMEKEFEAGVDDAIKQARSDIQPAAALKRASVMLIDESTAAWRIFNVLAFMAEAIPDDDRDGLPVKCTLINLREDMEKLALNLMDLVSKAKSDVEDGGGPA
ncbi:hypothetical protein AB1286_30030 [Trinickia sp. NRRL B-1857]|uniref:hypothetical protein n=1 Tax=Trinickia sp. NRRL B-1857 TaxID=3162879 RepID=UPI003D2DCA83